MRRVSEKHYISDETARFSALVMVYVSLNAFGFMVLFREPPNTMRDILIALMGSLTTIFVQQVQYYNKTGISTDRQKDDTINKLTSTAASIQAAIAPAEPTISLAPGESATVAAAPENPTNGNPDEPKQV